MIKNTNGRCLVNQDLIQKMDGDRWILTSALQKMIRRGEEVLALQAAKALWKQDKRKFWNRVDLICLEDCGIASLPNITEVLQICNSAKIRKDMGDLNAALYVTGVLARAEKTRFCDELYSQATVGPVSDAVGLLKLNESQLRSLVADHNSPIVRRALALWLLAGTDRFPSDRYQRKGISLQSLQDIIAGLNADIAFSAACIEDLGKTRHPLRLFSPLILQELSKQQVSVVAEQLLTPVEFGIPLCALDMFTRLGKSCFRILQISVPTLREFTVRQIGLGIFYTEGSLIDRRITNPYLEEFRLAGEMADMAAAGLCIARSIGLRETLQKYQFVLNDIRRAELKRYLAEWQEQQMFDGVAQ